MAYRRFYMDKKEVTSRATLPGQSPGFGDNGLTIGGDLFHHIRDVCRFGAGDRFEVLFGDAKALLVEISAVGKRELAAKVISERALPPPAKPEIILALSIPKLPKVDWIAEKCVELGVAEIRPFVSDFSFLRKTSEISESRLKRWGKIVEAATQQCGRGDLMRLQQAETLENLLKRFNQQSGAAGLFPYEGEAQLRLPAAIQEVKARNPEQIWLFVGSEGGWSQREVLLFAEHGMKPVSMGSQVLRVETACVALASVIKYECGALV
jgi:16S rRNA (uracil1498-N3)-methyltransferase